MNLINWLLNSKIHANMYFEFSYGNTTQCNRQKIILLFFLFLFLLKGLRKINEKKRRKKMEGNRKAKGLFCFFIIYIPFLLFFFFLFRGTRSTLTG